jgi:hypothetical protein
MSVVISIDPGKHFLGVASWIDQELVDARLHETVGYQPPFVLDVLAIERPMIYPGRAQKGRQRDLIELAMIAGRIQERAGRAKVFCFDPYQWKAQLPKAVTRDRVQEILSEQELGRIIKPRKASLIHNIFDAIGIGLVYLGRARRGLV